MPKRGLYKGTGLLGDLFHEENLSLFQERYNRAHCFAHMETCHLPIFSFFSFSTTFNVQVQDTCTHGTTNMMNLFDAQ